MDIHQRHRLYFILLVVLTILFLTGWICSSERLRQQQHTAALSRIAESLASNLSISVHNSTLSLYGIGLLALQSEGSVYGLANMVDRMKARSPNILNVAIMPEGVVRQIEPLESNRAALGHDMFRDPDRIEDAILARDTRQMTVAGPYELIQGGRAVIARLPLYMDANEQEGERFWGFVSIVYKFPELIESMLLQYQDDDLLFAILSAQQDMIISNTEYFPAGSVEHWIDLPNNRWLLKLASRPTFNGILALKIGAAALLTLILTYIYRRILATIATQFQLRKMLAEKGLQQTHQRNLLAHISHDLRAPMQHILHEIRNLARGDDRQQAQKIENSIRYQLSLIDQLLDYTHQQGRGGDNCPVPGYMYSFLQQLSEQAQSLAEVHGNDFCLDLVPDLPSIIEADFDALQRILMNLLSNAAKFTPKGSITLSVQTLPPVDTHSHRLRFGVKDEGPGMPDTNSRGQHANSGHGLGLMIVSDLLKQMGSQLQYRANPGGGADFYFDLELPITTEPPEPYIESHVLNWEGSGLTLLLIEPDPFAAAHMEELLLGYGIDVLISDRVDDALSILLQEPVDLIMTELDLPDGSAHNLLTAMAHGSTSVPVILYSTRPNFSRSDVKQTEQDYHFAAEMLRPVKSDLLLMQIKQLTEGANQ